MWHTCPAACLMTYIMHGIDRTKHTAAAGCTHSTQWGIWCWMMDCFPAEMILLCGSHHPRPGIPAWLGCRVMAVPAALARYQGQPVEADVTVAQRTSLRRAVLESRPWTAVQDLLSEDGWIDIQGPSQGAWQCITLVESGTQVREMQAQAHAAAGVAAIAALSDDTVIRMIMFSTPEEAARRALLLFLLTWDPFYGMVLLGILLV